MSPTVKKLSGVWKVVVLVLGLALRYKESRHPTPATSSINVVVNLTNQVSTWYPINLPNRLNVFEEQYNSVVTGCCFPGSRILAQARARWVISGRWFACPGGILRVVEPGGGTR